MSGPTIKFRRSPDTTQADHVALQDIERRRRMTLAGALRAAREGCAAHSVAADIYDAQGSLVLRVDASGDWGAP